VARKGRTGNSTSQEFDVGHLIHGHSHQVLVERGVEPGRSELLLGVVGKTFAVEFVLEVLQGEGIVENFDRCQQANV